MRTGLYSSLIITLFLFSLSLHAQRVPVNGAAPVPSTPTVTNHVYPEQLSGTYSRTFNLNKAISDPALINMTTPIEQASVVTTFRDGMNREFQTVNKQASGLKRDVVQMSLLDEFGRESYKYMPYVPSTGNYNDGSLKKDPFAGSQQFNSALYPGENIFYSRTVYDGSPLYSITQYAAQGNSWLGSGRYVNIITRANVVADSVRKWEIGAGFEAIPVSGTIYQPGELMVNEKKDEQNKRVIEYADAIGRVVLIRKQNAASPAGHRGWINTYYIYDDLNQLRVVVSPQAVEQVMATWDLTAVMSGLCFRYGYDDRRRTIQTEEPDGGLKEVVYDNADRVVFMRDANNRRDGKWMVSFYDKKNRPVMTALYPSTQTREQLQASMEAATGSTTVSYTIPGSPELVFAVRENGRTEYKATQSITLTEGFESEINAEFVAEIDPSLVTNVETVEAVNVMPGITGYEPLTYNYYDDYSFAGAKAFDNSYTAQLQSSNHPDAEPLVASTMTTGRVTGMKQKVMGKDQWLSTTVHYDNKGRKIQLRADNISGGEDISTTLLEFNGKVISEALHHKTPRSSTAPSVKIVSIYTRDHNGRVLSVKRKINDNAAWERTVVQQEYDEAGHLKTKQLGVSTGGTALETLNYEYNVRGWLKSINRNYVEDPGNTTNKFGMDLNYDYGFNANQFNGNIAGIKWKGYNDRTARALGFNYDESNRLISADYSQQNQGSTAWTKDQKDFSVSNLYYDANGNIMSMTQRGMNGTTAQIIDSLKYGYLPNSNKLNFVTDKQNNSASTLGDFKEINNNETTDYLYDPAGNLVKDDNKGIGNIVYNHLNLQEEITVTGKGSIRYIYDASGNKLQKIIKTNGEPDKVYDYTFGFIYLNDSLQYAGTESGRVRAVYKSGQPMDFVFDYFIKDNMNNVRMVLTDQTDFSMYTATMETVQAAKENALFSNVEETRSAKPSGYPEDKSLSPQNTHVAKLNAKQGGKKIGPSIVLRVMAGDTVRIGAKAFYKSQGPSSEKNAIAPVEDMLVNLAEVFGSGSIAPGNHGATAENNTPFTRDFYANDYQRMKEKDPGQAQAGQPKAYLNFVLFDDDFKLVEQNSGVRQVKGQPDELQTLAVDNMTIQKSGFLYVYTSNETPQDVLFDNVVLTVASGPVLEETHYYPFGLTMEDISYHAPQKLRNQFKYNAGAELVEDFDLDNYNTFYRTYDPQLGRFHGVDVAASKYHWNSPYSFAQNNPVMFNDPFGDITPAQYEAIISALTDMAGSNGNATWTADGNGGGTFSNISNHDAFLLGAGQLQINGAWGLNGNAGSYSQAAYNYNVKVTQDQRVPSTLFYLPGVTVRAYDPLGYSMAGKEIVNQIITATKDPNGKKILTPLEKVQLGFDAFGTAWDGKSHLIENVLIVESPAMANLKYVKAVKGVGYALTGVSVGLTILDIQASGRVKPSHLVSLVVTASSLIPVWGWMIGGAYFVADVITIKMTNKSIGDHIDQAYDGWRQEQAGHVNFTLMPKN